MAKQNTSLFPKLPGCFYRAMASMVKHDGVEHAGYMAFLGLLSLFPFLVFLVAFAGLFGAFDVGSRFVTLIFESMPKEFIKSLEPRINEIVSGPPINFLTIAILGVIWTASASVEGLRTALNKAYRVHTPPSYIFRRMKSIVEFMFFTVAIIIAMSILVFIPVITEWVIKKFPQVEPFISYIRFGSGSMILLTAAASLYYILPNIKVSFRRVLPGAFVAVILWAFAAAILSIYIETFTQVNLVYGGLAGFIIALLFLYITALIFIYGAEFNYQVEKMLGYKPTAREKRKK